MTIRHCPSTGLRHVATSSTKILGESLGFYCPTCGRYLHAEVIELRGTRSPRLPVPLWPDAFVVIPPHVPHLSQAKRWARGEPLRRPRADRVVEILRLLSAVDGEDPRA